MALDQTTLQSLNTLSKLWHVSKAEVMRRAVKHARLEADRQERQPKPLEALDWLQKGGGLSIEEAAEFRADVQAERMAKRYWWET